MRQPEDKPMFKIQPIKMSLLAPKAGRTKEDLKNWLHRPIDSYCIRNEQVINKWPKS